MPSGTPTLNRVSLVTLQCQDPPLATVFQWADLAPEPSRLSMIFLFLPGDDSAPNVDADANYRIRYFFSFSGFCLMLMHLFSSSH